MKYKRTNLITFLKFMRYRIYSLKIVILLFSLLSLIAAIIKCLNGKIVFEILLSSDWLKFIIDFTIMHLIIFSIHGFFILIGSRYADGTIYKRHQRSEFTSNGPAFLGRAQTNDKKYTTKWKVIPEYFKKYKDIPVKIIIRNNKAIYFFPYNYKFVNKRNLIKKK